MNKHFPLAFGISVNEKKNTCCLLKYTLEQSVAKSSTVINEEKTGTLEETTNIP